MNHLVGRILLALIFLIAGSRKLMATAATAGYFAKLGFPMPDVMVWLAIALELGGAILLIVGWKTRWAAWALALFTLIATFAAHRFWEISDAGQYANQMNHFLKNAAVIGGMLLLAATGPGPNSVDGRRRAP
jgi:putative oxidoreductase